MIYMSKLHYGHPLVYSDNIPHSVKCWKCTHHNIHAGFRCLPCKFDVHDHCLPLLPPTVKTKWHRHPLTLTHGPIKGESDEGDRDEGEKVDFYCDCCEEERDLKDPTYYCAECHLISHVCCVMWEIMDYLQGKSTKIEELCNTKVIVIGDARDRVEQGDHPHRRREDYDDIVIRLHHEIAEESTELMKLEAKLEKYQKKCEAKSSKLKRLEGKLSQRNAYKNEFK